MAVVKIERVVSFSSEDASHPAANLLGSPTSGGWLCSSDSRNDATAPSQAAVLLQLADLTRLTSVHIGNHGSAFIELQVGRQQGGVDGREGGGGGKADAIFKTLLRSSSFMTPVDSRNVANQQRVRMFDAVDSFAPDVASEYWDQVRIVCSQPFNRHIQFGISFVAFHGETLSVGGGGPAGKRSFAEAERNATANENVKNDASKMGGGKIVRLGQFSLRCSPTSSDGEEDGDRRTMLLNKRTCIRDQSWRGLGVNSTSRPPIVSNALTLAAQAVEDLRTQRVAKVSKSSDNDKRGGVVLSSIEARPTPPAASRNTRLDVDVKDRTCGAAVATPSPTSPTPTATPPSSDAKPLLGVGIVLSGYVNPRRAELRDKATEMGARYDTDWRDGISTHLVCAFANTPKLQELRRKVASDSLKSTPEVVSGGWIDACYRQRRLCDCCQFPAGKK